MRQHVTAGFIAFGVAALLGGVCALIYGLAHPGVTHVNGLGPFDGTWAAEDYCFLGGVMVALGGGLTTFAFLVRGKPETDRPAERDERASPARSIDPALREAFRGGPDR
jgi:hypothetical protein